MMYITVSQGLLCSVSRSLFTSLTFHDSFSKILGQCVHEGVSWRRPLLCTCSPYILWSSLRGKKGKFWKFEKSFGSEHVSPLFFLLLAPLPSPTATAPHYASQNRRIYFCILFKNIKLLRPIFGHFWHFFPVEDLREICKEKILKVPDQHVNPSFLLAAVANCYWYIFVFCSNIHCITLYYA